MESGDLWKVAGALVAAIGGGVIRDAFRKGKVASDLENLTDRVEDIEAVMEKTPCTTEIRCLERRAEVRREFDAGAAKFDRLEACIRHNEAASQKRHDDVMKILLEMNKS